MKPLGGEVVKKAMWLYPKVVGFNPSERWGHSACCSNGVVYIFGGCCGGLHFSDVLTLDLETMTWNTLVTTGRRPGTRDSHSAVSVDHKMIVFGGTNGSKKINDLHVLDLKTKEWAIPNCEGIPPSPRESHTATIVGDDKLVIFGGSGEGEGNYLNDLHILDLKSMRWIPVKVKGELPAPRDSHIAVAIDNKLLVYGGDCGDRYHGEVDILDMNTMTWSRLSVHGSSPGVRAGHAAVNMGSKVYVVGGVGDKHYYNDVWVLDVSTCSWSQLDIRGQQPQGRFSHTAVVTDSDIAIYGGCGEDERPLNEVLILQLGAEHPNGRYNISLCKTFGSHWNQEKRRFPRGAETHTVFGNKLELSKNACEQEPKNSLLRSSVNLAPKRKRTNDSKPWEIDSEQEEHSLSLSQHSSPSQSDQEQTPAKKLNSSTTEKVAAAGHPISLLKQRNHTPMDRRSSNIISTQCDQLSSLQRTQQDFHLTRQQKTEQFLPVNARRHDGQTEQFLPVNARRHDGQFLAVDQKPPEALPIHSLIGADVRGKVDGAFDSGYLMTANVNGKIFRGVLFTPGAGYLPRAAVLPQSPSTMIGNAMPVPQPHSTPNHMVPKNPNYVRTQSSPVVRANPYLARSNGLRNDLKDVVLTLGGPGSGDSGIP